jgi:hypothetical protein
MLNSKSRYWKQDYLSHLRAMILALTRQVHE